jgi:hypothetical protein
MLIELSKRCFRFASGFALAVFIAVGCGAAPDDRAESKQESDTATAEQSAAQTSSSCPGYPDLQNPPAGCFSQYSHNYFHLGADCNGDGQSDLYYEHWQNYNCTSCRGTSVCVEDNGSGHPIPGTQYGVFQGQYRSCVDLFTGCRIYEFRNVLVDCDAC